MAPDDQLARGGPEHEYHYLVDREGRVFHDGTEIVDPPTLRFFLLGMTRTADDRWLVVCQGERNWFRAEGTPFVVQRLRLTRASGQVAAVDLELAGGHHERLDPGTLAVEGEHLRCRVRRGAFTAGFSRLAMQQIGALLEESPDGPVLRLAGVPYHLAGPAPSPDAPDRAADPRPEAHCSPVEATGRSA